MKETQYFVLDRISADYSEKIRPKHQQMTLSSEEQEYPKSKLEKKNEIIILGLIWLVLLSYVPKFAVFIVLILFFYYLKTSADAKKRRVNQQKSVVKKLWRVKHNDWYRRHNMPNYQKNYSHITNKKTSEAATYYVEALKREVSVCCYQSARLQESYCMCGKVIPADLIQIFVPID